MSREMQTFKEEMQVFKEESNRSRIEMNRKWGELANKMGTMAEDLVAPSISRILRQTVPCPDGRAESVAVHMRRVHPADPGREREFDVVAVCGEYVLTNETKSRLTIQNVEDFTYRMPEAREFFPEYAGKKIRGGDRLFVRGRKCGPVRREAGPDRPGLWGRCDGGAEHTRFYPPCLLRGASGDQPP